MHGHAPVDVSVVRSIERSNDCWINRSGDRLVEGSFDHTPCGKKRIAGPWPTGVLENQFWLFLVNTPLLPREALRPATPTFKDRSGSSDMLFAA